MTSIPLALFLIPYGVFLIIYAFFLFFNLHHLRIYAIKSTSSHILRFVFLFGTIIILGASALLLSRFDWSASINIQQLTTPFTNTDVLKQPL